MLLLRNKGNVAFTRYYRHFSQRNRGNSEKYALQETLRKKLPKMASNVQWDRMVDYLQEQVNVNPRNKQTIYINGLHTALSYQKYDCASSFAKTLFKDVPQPYYKTLDVTNYFTLTTLVRYWKHTKDRKNIIGLYDRVVQKSEKHKLFSEKVLQIVLEILISEKDFDGVIARIKAAVDRIDFKEDDRDPAVFIYAMGITAAINKQDYRSATEFINTVLASSSSAVKDGKAVVPVSEWIYNGAITAAIPNDFNMMKANHLALTVESKAAAQAATTFSKTLVSNALASVNDIATLQPSTIANILYTLATKREWKQITDIFDQGIKVPDVKSTKTKIGIQICSITVRAYCAQKEFEKALDVLSTFHKDHIDSYAYASGCQAAAALGDLETVEALRAANKKNFGKTLSASTAVRAACATGELNTALAYHREEVATPLRVNDKYSFTLRILMKSLLQAERYTDAITAYESFAVIDGTNSTRKPVFKATWETLVKCYGMKGNYRMAESVLRKGLDIGLSDKDGSLQAFLDEIEKR